MEGETAYELAQYENKEIKIAPPALLLYFYFKLKIGQNTNKYDFQIFYLTKSGFPYINYKECLIYHPLRIVSPRYEYHKNILYK